MEAPWWYTERQQREFVAEKIADASLEVAEFKRAFSLYDKDKNGTISTTDIVKVMMALGVDLQNKQQRDWQWLINELDAGGSGTIHLLPFCALLWRLATSEPEPSDGWR